MQPTSILAWVAAAGDPLACRVSWGWGHPLCAAWCRPASSVRGWRCRDHPVFAACPPPAYPGAALDRCCVASGRRDGLTARAFDGTNARRRPAASPRQRVRSRNRRSSSARAKSATDGECILSCGVAQPGQTIRSPTTIQPSAVLSGGSMSWRSAQRAHRIISKLISRCCPFIRPLEQSRRGQAVPRLSARSSHSRSRRVHNRAQTARRKLHSRACAPVPPRPAAERSRHRYCGGVRLPVPRCSVPVLLGLVGFMLRALRDARKGHARAPGGRSR